MINREVRYYVFPEKHPNVPFDYFECWAPANGGLRPSQVVEYDYRGRRYHFLIKSVNSFLMNAVGVLTASGSATDQ